jgi:hypothetical protein
VVVIVPVLYVASFGPACWTSSCTNFGPRVVSIVYDPLMRLSVDAYSSEIQTGWFAQAPFTYSGLFSRQGWIWVVETVETDGNEFRWVWVDVSSR